MKESDSLVSTLSLGSREFSTGQAVILGRFPLTNRATSPGQGLNLIVGNFYRKRLNKVVATSMPRIY